MRHVSSAMLACVFSLCVALLAMTTGCLGTGSLEGDTRCEVDGQAVIAAHCLRCHSSEVPDEYRLEAPSRVNFDSVADVRRQLRDIRRFAIDDPTMPPFEPLNECDQETLGKYLDELEACVSDCSGRECGDDGCGASCGVCVAGTCNAQGQCE